ncbi:MAG: hypothetical protein QM756_31620 [Polyangiaceae bacterium]
MVARILEARGMKPELAAFAQGSAEVAFELADPDALAEREAFAAAVQSAVDAKDLAPAIKFAESQKGDRDALKAQLGFFGQKLANAAREQVKLDPARAERAARRHAAVLSAMTDIEANVQTALVLETMVQVLRRL